MDKILNYINGNLTSNSDNYLPVFNPSTGEQISKVINTSSDEIKKAINNSMESFYKWSEISPLKRSRILFKYKQIIEKNLDYLAKIISTEHGKTIDDAKGSITRGLEVIEFACAFQTCRHHCGPKLFAFMYVLGELKRSK